MRTRSTGGRRKGALPNRAVRQRGEKCHHHTTHDCDVFSHFRFCMRCLTVSGSLGAAGLVDYWRDASRVSKVWLRMVGFQVGLWATHAFCCKKQVQGLRSAGVPSELFWIPYQRSQQFSSSSRGGRNALAELLVLALIAPMPFAVTFVYELRRTLPARSHFTYPHQSGASWATKAWMFSWRPLGVIEIPRTTCRWRCRRARCTSRKTVLRSNWITSRTSSWRRLPFRAVAGISAWIGQHV